MFIIKAKVSDEQQSFVQDFFYISGWLTVQEYLCVTQEVMQKVVNLVTVRFDYFLGLFYVHAKAIIKHL